MYHSPGYQSIHFSFFCTIRKGCFLLARCENFFVAKRLVKSIAMFSFRKQDPDEDIPAINIGGAEETPLSPTRGTKRNSDRAKATLPLPSMHEPIPVITLATPDEHVPQIPLHVESSAISDRRTDDPFRFIDAEPVRDHDARIHDDKHSMSPTLRSALISCSYTTGVLSSD